MTLDIVYVRAFDTRYRVYKGAFHSLQVQVINTRAPRDLRLASETSTPTTLPPRCFTACAMGTSALPPPNPTSRSPESSAIPDPRQGTAKELDHRAKMLEIICLRPREYRNDITPASVAQLAAAGVSGEIYVIQCWLTRHWQVWTGARGRASTSALGPRPLMSFLATRGTLRN